MGLSRWNKAIATALLAAAAAAPAATVQADSLLSWQLTAQRMAGLWPALQHPDGTFPAYNYAKASGLNPYGESMLGYGLLQSGLAANDHRQIDAGMRAIGFASQALLRRGSPSVFENMALAASYNLARRELPNDPAFAAVRPVLERALRAIRPVWSGSDHHYFNKYLVEAVAWLELVRTGLHSSVPGTVLADPARARRTAAVLVNRLVGSPALGLKATGSGEHRALVLSDPPYNPAAYQGLSLGMFARAITLLGPDASAHAHRVLREVANASWELTGPDGDLAYYGRSQEEAWALGLTAYGAEVAVDGASEDQARRYRALAVRAMQRLSDSYPVGPEGLWITPATAQNLKAARRGLDRYADSVAYTGLSLVATEWAASLQDAKPASSIAADTKSSYVVGQGRSRMAVVRTPSLWFAVKQARSEPQDLRYDFGLVAMKARHADNSWTNVIPSLPKVQGHADSAGPVLLTPRGRAFATGRSIRAASGGGVTVRGSFATASGRRVRAARFTYRPDGSCVTLSFTLLAGERASWSAFVRRGASVSADGLRARGEHISLAPAAAAYRIEHNYSSGSDAILDRARFELRGPAAIRIATCSDR